MANFTNLIIDDDNNFTLPSGTTAQRPASPTAGMIRFNTDIGSIEIYDGSSWAAAGDNSVEASGGIVVDTVINGLQYRLHYFTDTGNNPLTVSRGGEVDFLIVAGGGGGGGRSGGGGGAGGFIEGTALVNAGSYTVTVGAGGSGGSGDRSSSAAGDKGEDSSVFGFTAIGGGEGAGYINAPHPDGSGGSGGGAPLDGEDGGGGSGVPGQGNDGGNSTSTSGWSSGGGGGGAGGPGEQGGPDGVSGKGGDGRPSSITGNMVFYAGGGGAGSTNGDYNLGGAPGGIGGGGDGGSDTTRAPLNRAAQNGAPNSGGGGGGGDEDEFDPGGRGGDGIVIIRYLKNPSSAVDADRQTYSYLPRGTQIIQEDLVFHFDANNPVCYPSTGNSIKNLGTGTTTDAVLSGASLTKDNVYTFNFNGSNDRIDTNLLFDKRDFTYAAWFRWAGQSSESNQDIIDSIDDNSQEWARIQIQNDNGEFWFIIDNDGSKVNGQSGFFVDENKWYYGVGVWTRSSGLMEVYINGDKVYDTTHPNTSTIVAVNSEHIGSSSRASEFFNGDIAEAQIYKKALTPQEVKQNFVSGRARYGI